MFNFIHLRLCSDYSLLFSALTIDKTLELCAANNMPAVALTDKHNLFGALEFAEKAVKKGVQPIIGCWIEIRHKKDADHCHDALLLAQNEEGYFNLLKLVSDSFAHSVENPFVPLEELLSHNNGLLLLGGMPNSGIMTALAQGRLDYRILAMLKENFSNRLYVEIQRHNSPEENDIASLLIDFAYNNDLPLVATNCALFPDKDSHPAHDALICISDGCYVDDVNRRRFNSEYYFKSSAEMEELFYDLPEAIENTICIAQRCCFAPRAKNPELPAYADGRPAEEALAEYAWAGLEHRLTNYVYTDSMSDEEKESARNRYTERMDYELRMICEMKYAVYFLIVHDFIKWSKENGVSVGPGRGSGAGSLVTWCLSITNIDPIRFGLIFERFLNPERVSMPDIDIDFCQEKRDLVIEYIRKKYGHECVAQIITFGTLQARGVLRDVGRALQMSYNYVDRLCRMIPNNPANPVTLSEAIEMDANLRAERDNNEAAALLFDNALRLEGLHRHTSTHAAGVVISHKPLQQIIPVCVDKETGRLLTQFSMKYVEKTGLIKFDFLGLKTLTLIANAVEAVRKSEPNFDIDRIDLNDPKTYELLASGNNIGLFQLESIYVIDILRKMKPNCIEDVVALVSLNRPGPMENIPKYIDRKNGNEEIDYLHPMLRDILRETFGIIVYQEQVMHIAQKMAGYSLGGADILRRAMGKKIKEEMDSQKQIFVEGSVRNGVDVEKASYIFDLVAKFAGYGFNKSHAAAYAVISVQTAYLKAHYPREFFVALMSLDIDDTNKLFVLCRDAELNNIKILPPDVNKSAALFAVEGDDAIRYALGACKNVGIAFTRELEAERKKNGPFGDIFSFVERLAGKINKKLLEALIKSGALSCIHSNAKQLFDSVETLIAYASLYQKEKACHQTSMFDDVFDISVSKPQLKTSAEWTGDEWLQHEFEAFGFYLTRHPVESYQNKLKKAGVKTVRDVVRAGSADAVAMAGVISNVKIKPSKRGRMATIALSDHTAMISCAVYEDNLVTPDLLYVGALIYLRAKITRDDNGMRVTAITIQPLKTFLMSLGSAVVISINENISDESLGEIETLLGSPASPFARQTSVKLRVVAGEKAVVMDLLQTYNPKPQDLIKIQQIKGVCEVLID